MAGDYAANEAFVRDAVARGEIADFTRTPGYNAEQKPRIGAAFLRRLMLGLELDAEGKAVKALLPGVRIKGALLDGALDLADCAGAGGGGLPALALDVCDLPYRIDLSHARLARLSLEGSRFHALWGAGLRLDGDLNFIRAIPAPAAIGGDETAYIRLRAARIGGDIWGRGARLCAPAGIPEGMEAVPSTFHAQDADIGGSVVLDDGFSAKGPVSLFGAEIGGTLQCDGARFSNSGREALFANNAAIGGDVLLRGAGVQRFEADGSVSLAGIKLGGSLDCSGGRFANAHGHALLAENAEIGGAVMLRADAEQRFEADGEISLFNTKVRGSLDCEGGRFTGLDGYALRASGIQVGGDVVLGSNASHRFESSGAVSFTGANIAGNLGSFGGRLVNSNGYALLADNAEIGGGVLMTLSGKQRHEAEGTVLLSGTKIGGTLDCGGGRFVKGNGYAMLAENVEIGGAMLLRALAGQPFEAEGVVSFLGAKVARDVELHGAKFKDDGWALGLQNARIEGRCAAWDNEIKGSVGLAGLRVGRLFDDPATAWGDPKSKFLIDLSEIDLDRIGVPIGAARPLWRARAKWLRRNTGEFVGEKLSKFSNQPWRQVAAAFERAGLRGDARRIRREEQRELNKQRFVIARPFVWLFAEQMFGYGLSVTRAAVTVFAVWLIGAMGVAAMSARGALVAVHGAEVTSQACVGLDPALYALDAMAPVINLDQESACVPGRVAGRTLFPGYQTAVGVVFEELALWQWAKALFSILGAAVVGFALLTWTGVFKPRAD